jgi:hypothetical protein
MDDVELGKNCVTTECGHCFHASCVMRNVALNGFACPMCRTAMAEEPEEEASEWSEVSDEEEMFDDFALRGFRFFMNNIEGEQHDNEDELEEQEDMEEADEEVQPVVAKPTVAFMAQKLVEQGISMEPLLKVLLRDHEEYDAEDEEFERVDDDVFGKIRIIVSNYEPPAEAQPDVAQQQAPEPEQQPIDQSAQPKRYANVTVRRPMMHV